MINFRYHIVSLTAVLLALGIGLALGTTFLDEATVDVLRRQLDRLESNLDDTRAHAAELQAQVERLEGEQQAMDEEFGRVLGQQLAAEPVLVIAPRGIDGDLGARVVEALGDADADVLGVWWLTDRFTLEHEDDIEDLAAVLNLTTTNATRLQRDVVVRLAGILDGAMAAPTDDGSGAEVQDGSGAAPNPAQPDLLDRLRDVGFVDYEMPEGSDGDVIDLPAGGMRVVLVSGPGAEVPPELLRQVLSELVSEGPVPVVIASPLGTEDDGEPEEGEETPSLLQEIREDDELASQVSTVDNLDRVAGKVATVLALRDAVPGAPFIGHYGLADGAERLLPPAEEDR